MKTSKLTAAAIWALIAAGILVLLRQQNTFNTLQKEIITLAQQSRQRRDSEPSPRNVEALQRYRSEAAEVHGLRKAVTELTRQKRDLEDEVQALKSQAGKRPNHQDPGKQQALVETGEKLDVAIDGVGFFQVQITDGIPGYTRHGHLKLAPDGHLLTCEGLGLTGTFPTVPQDAVNIAIASNGDVSLVLRGKSEPSQPSRLTLCRFPNSAALEFDDGFNVYRETIASGPVEVGYPGENGFGNLAQGFLEALD